MHFRFQRGKDESEANTKLIQKLNADLEALTLKYVLKRIKRLFVRTIN